MDLGLSTLTDDQTLELLQQVLAELATRDPLVREYAQKTIVTESEKLDAVKKSMECVKRNLIEEYKRTVQREIEDQVRAEVASGEIKLLSSEDEVAYVMQCYQKTKDALEVTASEIREKLSTNGWKFSFSVEGDQLRVSNGSSAISTRHTLTADQVFKITSLFNGLMQETTRNFFK